MQDAGTFTAPRPKEKLDHSFFWGSWQNTDASGGGIRRVEFCDQDGSLLMHVFGAGEDQLIDWGTVRARVFADNVDSIEGTKFAELAEQFPDDVNVDALRNSL